MTTAKDPAWLSCARKLIGTREARGAANSATILGWAALLGMKILGIVYNADSTPWCGLFVANCLRAAGIDLSAMKVGVRASAWADWGDQIRMGALAAGAIMVFVRPGGGHVGFYVGEDMTHFHILGGNQGDAVSIMRIEKNRCVAARWPRGVPVTGAPIWMTRIAGVQVSTDEA
jgi:uncharacterized protein (TIGR02594 family)